MIGQLITDGIVAGSTLALGAIGLTMTYDIMRFANFAHGEFLTFAAYFALMFVGAFGGVQTFGPLTFGWTFIVGMIIAVVLTAVLALVLDWLIYRPLRRSNIVITLVIASFGAELMLRNIAVFIWGSQPRFYSTAISIHREILPGIRVSADDIFLVALTAVLMIALQLFLTRTQLGKEMRAVSDNSDLARVTGISVRRIIRWVWIIGGGLAAVSGVLVGLTVQISPENGFSLILPLFAAAIVGGIGSIYGAVAGGLIIGLVESLSVPLMGAQYKLAAAFIVMLVVLLVRPRGIFGAKS